MNEIIGLTNVVTAQPRNIFDLGNDLGYEFSKLLVVIKAAELLDLVTTPGENVLLTETGRRFLAADVSKRRTILRERMMALPLFNRLVHIIEEAPDQLISIIEFFDCLKEWFPNENLQELARTIIGWSRFAGFLVYSSVSRLAPKQACAGRGRGTFLKFEQEAPFCLFRRSEFWPRTKDCCTHAHERCSLLNRRHEIVTHSHREGG